MDCQAPFMTEYSWIRNLEQLFPWACWEVHQVGVGWRCLIACGLHPKTPRLLNALLRTQFFHSVSCTHAVGQCCIMLPGNTEQSERKVSRIYICVCEKDSCPYCCIYFFLYMYLLAYRLGQLIAVALILIHLFVCCLVQNMFTFCVFCLLR